MSDGEQITQENPDLEGEGEEKKNPYPNLTDEKKEEIQENFDALDKARSGRLGFFDL